MRRPELVPSRYPTAVQAHDLGSRRYRIWVLWQEVRWGAPVLLKWALFGAVAGTVVWQLLFRQHRCV